MNALEIDALDVHYGRIQALRGLTLRVGDGEIVAVLGNNGAGKTSTLAAVSGVVRATAGSIHALGSDITRETPWHIVARGIIHVPEGRRIFSRLTVHENLQLGGYLADDRASVEDRITEVYDILPRLKDRRSQDGGNLSGGEQQMLAMGVASCPDPSCCCSTSHR